MENRRVGDAQRAHYSSVDIQLATNLNYGCIQRSTDFGCSSLFDQKITMHDTIHRKFCWFHYNYRASQNSLNICKSVPWIMSRELLGSIAKYHNDVDGIILLTAFPCGPDSMINEMIIRRIKDRPILNLLLDSQDGNAGIETRLESFIDIIRFRKEARL